MINRRFLAPGAIVAIAVGVAACGDITSLNQNPNDPEDVPASTIFTNAARSSVSRWLGTAYDLRGTEFVAQHFGEAQYPDEDRYSRLTGGSTDTWFTGPYTSELEDLRKVIQKGRDASQPGVYAPAVVLQTWGFSYLTDTWGDIPYSEALLGDTVDATSTPAYDPQQQIYDGMFAALQDATTALTGASGELGSADPIFGGSPVGWQKFANSLRARLALRIVNVDPAKASSELTAAFTAPGGVIQTNADNAQLAWPGDGVYNNPWSDNFKGRDDHRMSQTLMNIIVPLEDPRVAIFAMPVEGTTDEYVGMPNGLTGPQEYLTTASRPGAIFYPGLTTVGTFGGSGGSQPSYLMTAAEVLFIKAEAAERGLGGLNPGQAAGFYDAAIRASMEQWGATGVDAYLARSEVAYKGGTAGLKQIGVQRWIALYSDGGQAWAEWRRTCQPETVRPGPAAITDEVPRRFQYGPAEYAANRDQVDAAAARMGGNEFETRMWWDNAPTAAPTYIAGCGVRQ